MTEKEYNREDGFVKNMHKSSLNQLIELKKILDIGYIVMNFTQNGDKFIPNDDETKNGLKLCNIDPNSDKVKKILSSSNVGDKGTLYEFEYEVIDK
jgi:hypothetical protein